MIAVRVQVVRFVDDSFPGFVECELIDAHGRRWLFVEKGPVVTTEHLTAQTFVSYTGNRCLRGGLSSKIKSPKLTPFVRGTLSQQTGNHNSMCRRNCWWSCHRTTRSTCHTICCDATSLVSIGSRFYSAAGQSYFGWPCPYLSAAECDGPFLEGLSTTQKRELGANEKAG